MVDPTCRPPCPAYRFRTGTEVLDKFLNGLIGRGGRNSDHLVLVQQASQRYGLFERHGTCVRADRPQHHLTKDHQRTWRIPMSRHEISQSDRTSGATPIDHLYRNPENAHLSPHLTNLSRCLVPASSRICWSNERDRPSWKPRRRWGQTSTRLVAVTPDHSESHEKHGHRTRVSRTSHQKIHSSSVHASVPRPYLVNPVLPLAGHDSARRDSSGSHLRPGSLRSAPLPQCPQLRVQRRCRHHQAPAKCPSR